MKQPRPTQEHNRDKEFEIYTRSRHAERREIDIVIFYFLESTPTMNSNAETLELYRMMVATVTANEQRRQQISSVFITLLAAGFGAAGALENFNMIFATSAALVVSFVWFMQVRFLKQLAAAKFHVIGQLEEQLPFQPFAEEWKFLKRDISSQKWARLNLSDIEMIVPVCVFLASVAHITWFAWGK